jgi:hypothetical protein
MVWLRLTVCAYIALLAAFERCGGASPISGDPGASAPAVNADGP